MPNIITHKIFAEEVLKKLDNADIRRVIERNLQLYYIGSNGPDFLFFYHAKPWEALKNHDMNRIGSDLHSRGINAFYQSAVHSICREKCESVKERMTAYILGHLCHWALDMSAHPYIFYRTGNCCGKSAAHHHRFESMMDTMMLEEFHGMTIAEYPYYEICTYDEEMLKAIARIYVPAVRAALQKDIKVYDLRVSLNEWKDIQRLLYDPHNYKIVLLKGMEKMLKKPWLISGNVVLKHTDLHFDILNKEKREWMHPCDGSRTHRDSFMELFYQAVDIAVSVIEELYGCVAYGAPKEKLLSLLDDRAYDTGMRGEKDMKYFKIIYEEEDK